MIDADGIHPSREISVFILIPPPVFLPVSSLIKISLHQENLSLFMRSDQTARSNSTLQETGRVYPGCLINMNNDDEMLDSLDHHRRLLRRGGPRGGGGKGV
jgi:hypothetical protein